MHIYSDAGGDDVVALRGVDVDVASGERVALLGPSGAGKSTLLTLLGGLVRASAGSLQLDGVEIRSLSERQLARLRATGVGTVLQGAARNLLPYATAEQNIAFVQRSLPTRERSELLPPKSLLEAMGLGGLARAPLSGLSGGEL